MNDQTPVIQLKGIGEKTQKLLEKLEIRSVGDLIRHFPRDYETFGEPVMIDAAKPGEVEAVRVCVAGIPNLKKVRGLTILNVTVRDASGGMSLTFYNMPYLKSVLRTGGFYIFRGLVQTRGRSKLMEQPRLYSETDYREKMRFIQPRYGLTKGLTNQTLQKAVKQALTYYEFQPEPYPDWILSDYALASEKEALCDMHFPEDRASLLKARKRAVFDEFFTFLFFLQKNKDLTKKVPNEYPMEEVAAAEAFRNALPFGLTGAQRRVWEEIKADLKGPCCMNRLIQGDVGSGKTIVAVLALLLCVSSGYQGALMAPTEVLAAQHFETLTDYTARYGLPFRPVLLVGSMTAGEKRKAYESIRSGEANLVIGTHALIQEKVVYHSLALVVTDEQHRFGVKQRERLAEKGHLPHVLVMSATPIPRTLALILYGDLQISVIDELPSNRKPIKNCVVNTSYRPKAYEFIARQVSEGRQAYVICPMVEEGELEDCENVADYAGKLRAALPDRIRVEYLHGKMKAGEKNRIMEEFSRGDIQVLVSTTVIEVGINVPNAAVMMVENAERFGLAQLHQLRGRVGRGEHQSYCIFISAKENRETMERLEILNHSNDGFYIASQDLKLRGPGDLFGIRQSGEFAFRTGDIYGDAPILQKAKEAVDRLLTLDPGLEAPEHALLAGRLAQNLENSIDFRSI